MLNEQMKLIRKANKFTQEQTAKALNIERSTYASYETGRNRPDISLLEIFARTFGVTVDFILNLDTQAEMSDVAKPYNGEDNSLVLSKLNSEEKDIIAFYRNCSQEDKDRIKSIIERK
ncbi:MAG: helix-turn-helix transcriptional regulator [Ruminococcaceae bacterium]|nr:helix-turn-helix transcriptional regulator [Oscillospiraceae bacterium]